MDEGQKHNLKEWCQNKVSVQTQDVDQVIGVIMHAEGWKYVWKHVNLLTFIRGIMSEIQEKITHMLH